MLLLTHIDTYLASMLARNHRGYARDIIIIIILSRFRVWRTQVQYEQGRQDLNTDDLLTNLDFS